MSKYNKRIYVPSSRKKANEAFSKAFINRIVQAVEGGLSRKELCHMHGMSSTTLAEWMSRYGSIRYHQNKKKSFSETERNVTARAVLEGRVSIKEAALSKGVRRTTIQQWIRQNKHKRLTFL